MGTRCIINVHDLTDHGVVSIVYNKIGDEIHPVATMLGWQAPGDYHNGTVEFDFNSWGNTHKWLEPWLIKRGVPFRIT